MKKNNKNKRLLEYVVPLCIIAIVILAFFFRVFYPQLQLFICPDFGLGDVWYFNYPVKNFLGESLRRGELPLWNKDIGTGFPLLAEGQIAPFYLPNLLYAIADTTLIFNVQYLLAFLIAAFGMFFYLRLHTLSKVLSVFGALMLVFSGYFITQISHLNLLQSMSFIPWILFYFEKLWKKNTVGYAVMLSFLLSQQFFAGYTQISFITAVMVGVIYIIKIFQHRKQNIIPFIIYAAGISVTVAMLAAVQLLPSSELLNLSVRKGGFSPTYASYFSYPFSHFLTLLDPFALGNPKEGTYPGNFDGSFFWENTGYIGIIPLILALFSLFHDKRRKISVVFFCLLILSGLLMLGKYGPLYVVYAIPPFTYFRVPSRFLLSFIFSLIVLSTIGLEQLISYIKYLLRKTASSRLIIFLSITLAATPVVILFSTWYGYHLIEPAQRWIGAPETANFFSNKKNDRIFTMAGNGLWEKYYLTNGWQRPDGYRYFRNALLPNSNLLWHIPQYGIYVGNVETRRLDYYNSLISAELQAITATDSSSLHPTHLISAANIRYLITPNKLENTKQLKLVYETVTNPKELTSFKIYENLAVLPRARMVYRFKTADTLFTMQKYLAEKDVPDTAVLEQSVALPASQATSKPTWDIHWIRNDHQRIELAVNTDTKGLLILADTYYPGWKAYVNDKKTEIYPANLNQRAIVVEKGSHVVKFSYEPQSFKIGAIISIISHIVTIGLMVFLYRMPTFHISLGKKWPFRHH